MKQNADNSFEKKNSQTNAEKENKDYKEKLRRFENDLHDKVKYMYFQLLTIWGNFS